MKQTTPSSTEQKDALKGKNEAINEVITAAYFDIIKDIKAALPLYLSDYFRTYMEVDYSSIGLNCKHGFYSPLLHLQLEDTEQGLTICFASNLTAKHQLGNHLSNLLTRLVYKHTGEGNTSEFIEDCLSVNNYNVDDFRQAKSLVDRGFKDGKKTTVEGLTN
jgi:hypothetical protein